MRHPFRRYCFILGEKLGKTLDEIMSLSSTEISEWMAYDQTKDDKWVKEYNKEEELKRQREMSWKDRGSMFKALFGGNK